MWIKAYLQTTACHSQEILVLVCYFITRLMGKSLILITLPKILRPQEQKCLGKVIQSLCYKMTQIHPNTSSTPNLIHLIRTIGRGLAVETRKYFKKIKILLTLSLFILNISFNNTINLDSIGRLFIILIYLEKSKTSSLSL